MNEKKIIALILSLVVVMGCAIGGTMAWLIADTKPVVNTFTYGDIDIELEENGAEYNPEDDQYENELEMIPGNDIPKDPTITVNKGSEECWLFVKVEKSDNFDDFLTYAMADGWTELEEGVYYCEVAANEEDDQEFPVLKDNKVTVLETVTKEMLNDLNKEGEEAKFPTMTFTAYAVQKANMATAADAWAAVVADQTAATETTAPAETTTPVAP